MERNRLIGGLAALLVVPMLLNCSGVRKSTSPEEQSNPQRNIKLYSVESEQNRKDLDLESIKKDLMYYEGVKYHAYDDPRGIRTIGVGFNLEREDSKKQIEDLNLNFKEIYSGERGLNEEQLQKLLDLRIKEAVSIAESYMGKNWDSLDSRAKEIIIDMAYNMGEVELSKFVRMKNELTERDYEGAAREMVDSNWYNQVGRRSKNLVRKMSSIK